MPSYSTDYLGQEAFFNLVAQELSPAAQLPRSGVLMTRSTKYTPYQLRRGARAPGDDDPRVKQSAENMIAELRAAYQSGTLGSRSRQFIGRLLSRGDVLRVVGTTMFPHLRRYAASSTI